MNKNETMKNDRHDCRQALIKKIGIPVEQGEVLAGTIRTAYLAAGEGAPLVFLHGAGAGAVTWYPSISTAAEHFHVIAPDVVGYGESDKPDAAYDRPFFAAWLKQFFLALGIRKAHIVGLSQGGAIALQFALENPDMVEKLVLVNSGALGAKPAFKPLMAMFWMNIFPSPAASRCVSRYLVSAPENADPDVTRYSIEVAQRPGGKNAFRQGRGAAVAPMSEETLGQVQNQTLIIWGEEDRLFSVDCAEVAAGVMPNAQLHRIRNAGHIPSVDQPREFNRVLMEFLRG